MKLLRSIALAAFLSDCVLACDSRLGGNTVPKPAASALANAEATTFLGTVKSVDIGKSDHPFLKWVVTLAIDKVESGPSPGEGFWFAIHSPSEEGVKVGQQYRITASKNSEGYELISRDLVN